MRIDYPAVAPQALQALGAVAKYLASTGMSPKLRALVELRVSQINGCAYCCDMHTHEARAAGEAQQRLDTLVAWRETTLFDDRERAALAWAEAVTELHPRHVPDDVFVMMQQHFSEKEIVDLTVAIAMMNTWNRMAISMRTPPRPR